MLLTCENCETIFRIEAAQLSKAGQQVRCSVCKHVWAPEIEDAPPAEAPLIRESLSILKKPLLICGVIVAFFTLASFNRDVISAYVPATIGVYDMTGLKIRPNIEQLEVRDLKASFQGDTLRISGQLANLGSLRTHAAPLQLSILDQDGVVLHSQRLMPSAVFIDGYGQSDFFIQLTIDDAEQAEIRVEPLAIRLAS